MIKGLYKILIIIFSFLIISSVYAEESIQFETEDIYSTTNITYKISDSPYLRLPEDIVNLPPMVPPEPREVGEIEDPTAIEIYDIATKKVTRLPSKDLIQETQKTDLDLSTTLPYNGLLPDGILQEETASIESIIGTDGRSRITSTSTYPWRTITQLIVTFPNGFQYGCSGAIIGRSDNNAFHVLTAGHCVYSNSDGGWATSIRVVPGLNGDYMPYNYAWATKLRSYSGWVNNQDHQHDWAVITLDRRVGNYVGWMGRQSDLYWSSIYTGTLYTAGYPCDKGGDEMWYDADSGRTATEYNHWYYMDTMGCQSGSPVWRMDGSDRYILTVHAYGDDGSGSNHGTRLDFEKFNRIPTWIDSDSLPNDKADLIDDGESYSGFSPTTVARGVTNFNVWNDVRNIGTTSSGGFYVKYYASTDIIISTSDYLIGTRYVSSISPFNWGDSDWSGTFPSSIPTGTYWVGWIVDSGNDVTEFDETNNKAYKTSYQLVVKKSPGDSCSSGSQCSSGYCEGSQSYPARCCSSTPPLDGYTCSSGNIRQYRDYYCTSSGSSNYEITSSYDCDSSDGCYSYSTGCEDRDYYCSDSSCIYSYSNRYTDYYDSYVNYCSSSSIRKHRKLHDYYCSSGTCSDHTSWSDDQLVENCDDDGWYDTSGWSCATGGCRKKKSQEYRDYTCLGSSCTYSVTNTQNVYENCPAGTACFGGTCSNSYYCNNNFACSSGGGDNNYNVGGSYGCQGSCDGSNHCDYAVNCADCGTDSCYDSGDLWEVKDYIIDYESCSAGVCLSDDTKYDYCVGDVVYDRRCVGKDEGGVAIKNCNDYDTSNCWCTIEGPILKENCDNWHCNDGACKDSNSDWIKNSWSCEESYQCRTHTCWDTYKCYRTNAGSWNWAESAESIEDNCDDGYDNDCDGYIDGEDSDCWECNNGETRYCPLQIGVCAGSQEVCTNHMWLGCDASNYGPNYENPESSCDNLDNNCDGSIDETWPNLGSVCGVGLGECYTEGTYICKEDHSGIECDATQGDPSSEICDGLDNDCDGIVDEDGYSLCDDGVFCNGMEICDGSNGCIAGTPEDCSFLDDECNDGYCNINTDQCEQKPTNEGQLCDELFCNEDETCQSGLCVGGTPIDVDDSIDCTIDTCNEDIDKIDHTTDDGYCDNGLYCDGQEYCDVTLDCQSGTSPDCSDDYSCTDDNCDENNDQCLNIPNNDNCQGDEFCDPLYFDPPTGCGIGTPPEVEDLKITTSNNIRFRARVDYTDQETIEQELTSIIQYRKQNSNEWLGCDELWHTNGYWYCIAQTNRNEENIKNLFRTMTCDPQGLCSEWEYQSVPTGNIFKPWNGFAECTIDTGCDYLDNDYCEKSLIMHDEGVCAGDNICRIQTTTVDCSDGLWCNGLETCENLVCTAGTSLDCSDTYDCTDDYCDDNNDVCINEPNDNNCAQEEICKPEYYPDTGCGILHPPEITRFDVTTGNYRRFTVKSNYQDQETPEGELTVIVQYQKDNNLGVWIDTNEEWLSEVRKPFWRTIIIDKPNFLYGTTVRTQACDIEGLCSEWQETYFQGNQIPEVTRFEARTNNHIRFRVIADYNDPQPLATAESKLKSTIQYKKDNIGIWTDCTETWLGIKSWWECIIVDRDNVAYGTTFRTMVCDQYNFCSDWTETYVEGLPPS